MLGREDAFVTRTPTRGAMAGLGSTLVLLLGLASGCASPSKDADAGAAGSDDTGRATECTTPMGPCPIWGEIQKGEVCNCNGILGTAK